MSKMQEALDKFRAECKNLGYGEGLTGKRAFAEDLASVAYAEAAVLALYEQQQKVADELAEAVRAYIEDDDATVSELKAALAAYNKVKEG